MAFVTSKILRNEIGSLVGRLNFTRWTHAHAQAISAPLSNAISHQTETTFVLPEFGNGPSTDLPGFGFGMELMAVPKKKVSKHKRGIRNGPKALKPIPVIVRCRCCGRVKRPHFYCCSGERGIGGLGDNN